MDNHLVQSKEKSKKTNYMWSPGIQQKTYHSSRPAPLPLIQYM